MNDSDEGEGWGLGGLEGGGPLAEVERVPSSFFELRREVVDVGLLLGPGPQWPYDDLMLSWSNNVARLAVLPCCS